MSIDDTRQARYAAALYQSANPGFRWEDLPEAAPERTAFLEDAVAIMAVADAELEELRAELRKLICWHEEDAETIKALIQPKGRKT